MQFVLLRKEEDGKVAILTLNRPKKGNALNMSLFKELGSALKSLAADESVKVVIITGSGKHFCVGVDVNESGRSSASSLVNVMFPVMKTYAEFPKPLIGAINGDAITGGMELALTCDFLIGTPRTRFRDTHVLVGIPPLWGLSQKLSRIIGVRAAMHFSLMSRYLGAEESHRRGLLQEVVAQEELMPRCLEIARALCTRSESAVLHIRKLIRDGFKKDLESGMKMEVNRGLRFKVDPMAFSKYMEGVKKMQKQRRSKL